MPECTTKINGQSAQIRTVPYLRRGEIDPFTRLNALQPILDMSLQLRMEFLPILYGKLTLNLSRQVPFRPGWLRLGGIKRSPRRGDRFAPCHIAHQ